MQIRIFSFQDGWEQWWEFNGRRVPEGLFARWRTFQNVGSQRGHIDSIAPVWDRVGSGGGTQWGRHCSNFSRQETFWHIANMTSFIWNGDSAKSVLLVWFYRKWRGIRFNYYEYYTKESHWLFERKTIKSDVEKNDRSPSYICDLKMKKVFVCSNPLLSPSWLTLTVPHRSGWEKQSKIMAIFSQTCVGLYLNISNCF